MGTAGIQAETVNLINPATLPLVNPHIRQAALVASVWPEECSGNRSQQHAFLVIWISLKWANHHMVPNLARITEKNNVSKRALERVRAKMRRMGLIDHVSRFSNRFGYRERWVLSPRFEKALVQLADRMAGFRTAEPGFTDKDRPLIQLALARRTAAAADQEREDDCESHD